MNRSITRLPLFVTLISVTACGPFKALFNKDKKDDESNICTEGTRSISRPIVPGQSAEFPYRYFFRAPTNPDAPVIVHIPGGPGQAGIYSRTLRDSYVEEAPEGFGVITTDPRGVGCNYIGDEFPGEFFSSENVAADIAAAIKDSGIKTYFVYGVSYGTVPGTMLSKKLSEIGATQPKVIIFEGTLAKILQDSSRDEYTKYFDEIMQSLPGKTHDRFKRRDYPIVGEDEWLAVSLALLRYGVYENDHRYSNLLRKLILKADSDDAEDRAAAKAVFAALQKDDDSEVPGFENFYLNIACKEVIEKIGDYSLDGDKINYDVSSSKDICKKYSSYVKSKAAPFDSSAWKIPTELLYFQGKKDPATPYAQATTHYDAQTQASARLFVSFERGAHNPFQSMLSADEQKTVLSSLKDSGVKNIISQLKKTPVPGISAKYAEKEKELVAENVNEDRDSAYSFTGSTSATHDLSLEEMISLIKKAKARMP